MPAREIATDVLVIGGGTAGFAAAMALAFGLPVQAIDRAAVVAVLRAQGVNRIGQ